jgi:DNA-binding MarR family transcriptional regulator
MSLWEKDAKSIIELLEHTKMDGGSTTQVLTKLEQKGLISILKDKEDKRRKFVKLTKNGRALEKKMKTVPNEIACHMPSINAKEAKELYRVMDKMISDLLL